MPIVPCTKNGVKGFKVENANTCFTGPNARKKAEQQLKAIKVNQSKGEDLKWLVELTDEELAEAIEGLSMTQQITINLMARSARKTIKDDKELAHPPGEEELKRNSKTKK
jgi:hypothetical protein